MTTTHPWQTSYNGWTFSQRCAVTPIQNAMFRSGELGRPTVCSICGFSDPARLEGQGYIFAHLERYDRPKELYPACKRCHAALHARFRDPDRWLNLCAKCVRPSVWFIELSMDPASQQQPFSITYPAGLPQVDYPPGLTDGIALRLTRPSASTYVRKRQPRLL